MIVKPHGLGGEVVVRLTTNRTERMDPGTVLAVGGGESDRSRRRAGRAVPAQTASNRAPLVVERSRPHQNCWIVRFAGVVTHQDAEGLRGVVLMADALHDPDALWVHDLVGCEVLDQRGVPLGPVESVESNPASDLLVLEGNRLVPLVFVRDHQPGRIIVEVPDGLLD